MAMHEKRALSQQGHLALLHACLETGILDDLRQQFDHIHAGEVTVALTGLGTGQGQQLLDQVVHAPRLALDPLQHVGPVGLLAHQADGGMHAGKR
ncbi:hypothetical protein D3C72_2116110 [compost metagenome]